MEIAVVLLFLGFILTPHQAQPTSFPNATRVYVENAIDRGAVCLDGSPFAYYLDKGQREGANNWIIYLQGGGWCVNQTDCFSRAYYAGGTSKNSYKSMQFTGFLSKNSAENPEFCNWNRVYVPYCDGSSFTGDSQDSVNNVTYGGGRIFKALMEDLIAQGMNFAQNAILSGGSAGGLAAMVHCDRFRELLPPSARVKCFAIAAYFLHDEKLLGSKQFESAFDALITLHGSVGMLPQLCTSVMTPPSLCFFPQYLLSYVKTPVFIAMSAFDQIQTRFNLFPEDEVCLVSQNCTYDRMEAIQELKWDFLVSLPKSNPLLRGLWITNCIAHILPYSWTLANKTKTSLCYEALPETFHNWFFDQNYIPVIEDPSKDPKNCSSLGIFPQPLPH